MSPKLHNILGNDGEVLTILSLLEPPGRPAEQSLGDMTLREAIQRITEIAGEEGRAQLVLSLHRGSTTDAFTTDQDVTLETLSAELLDLADQNGDAPVVLRRLTVADEPEDDDDDETDGGSTGTFRDALHRFAEALRGLFNIAGEDGEQLTILSLLVRQPPAAEPDEAP